MVFKELGVKTTNKCKFLKKIFRKWLDPLKSSPSKENHPF